MDHDDIIQLISAGKRDEVLALIAAREAQEGISGEDRQTLTRLLAKPQASTDAPAEEPARDLEPGPKAAQRRRSYPRGSAGKKD